MALFSSLESIEWPDFSQFPRPLCNRHNAVNRAGLFYWHPQLEPSPWPRLLCLKGLVGAGQKEQRIGRPSATSADLSAQNLALRPAARACNSRSQSDDSYISCWPLSTDPRVASLCSCPVRTRPFVHKPTQADNRFVKPCVLSAGSREPVLSRSRCRVVLINKHPALDEHSR